MISLNIPVRKEYFIDLTHKQVGDIKVIRKNGHNRHGQIRWLCKCKCGHQYNIEATTLNRNIIQRCHFCANTGKRNGSWAGCGEISGTYMGIIKSNAKRRNLKVNININYLWKLFLKQNRKCALSGIELKFNTHSKSYNGNASLDRIDNKKPYIRGNLQWVHKDINWMKQDFNEKYFIDMCKLIAKNNE